MQKIRDLGEVKENLRSAVDLVAYIEKYVELQQRGHNYFGCCPFHDDSTPSFNVTPAKGVWSCLGCRKSGDLYKFIEEFHKCSFLDALKIVAEENNFDLTPYYRPLTEEEQFLFAVYGCTHQIADLFHQELVKRPDLLMFYYERGITLPTLEQFKIGYCPSTAFLEANVDQPMIDIIEPNKERQEQIFGGHLLYPQFTADGNVWGWFARTDGKPKYWGPSRESRLFQGKARLYGMHTAKRLVARENAPIVLVEGFHDALATQQHGFAGIAVCGTELSTEQIQALHDHALRSAIVVFDGDDGGRAGMLRCAHRAYEIKNLNLKFGTIPGDPDEFLTQQGRDCFAEVLDKAVHAIEYVLIQNDYGDLTTTTAQLDFLNRVRPLVSVYPHDSLDRAIAVSAIAKRLDLPQLAIEDFFDEGLSDDPLVSMVGEQVILAELLCNSQGFTLLHDINIGWFSTSKHGTLFNLLSVLYRTNNIINLETVLLKIKNDKLGTVLIDFVNHLAKIDRTNLLVHVVDVRDKAIRRQAEAITKRSSLVLRDTKQPAMDTLANLSEKITKIVVSPTRNTLISAPVATDAAVAQLIERQKSGSEIAGLDLGREWSHLMGWINGFRGGRVHIVAAVSGVGKSVVGLANWVHRLSVSLDGPLNAAAIFSLEMSAIENTNRIAAIESRVPEKFIAHGRFETTNQMELVTETFALIRRSPITWVERIISVPDLAFQCRLLRAKGMCDYIVIDYLQLLDLSPYNERWSKVERFGQASQDLHDLAEELNVPIIAMAQLRRAAYEDEVHTGEDMAEAYKFYQDCHECFTLTPRAERKIMGFLDKNRGGPSKKAVDLIFDNDEHRATLLVREGGQTK